MEASKWVKKHGGRVILVHAVYSGEEELRDMPEIMKKQAVAGRDLCYQAREVISSEYGIEIEALVCEGEPPDVILEAARGKNADLIALGTYGRKGLKRLIMGSVTARVIVNSPCDVLVVKKPCSECTGEYDSLLIPVDGSEFSKKALIRACALSGIDNAFTTVLYVIPRYEEMIDFFKTDSIRKKLRGEAEKIVKAAKDIAAEHGITAKTMIEEGRAADRIEEVAERLETDLIVMGSYGWKGVNRAIMGSATERVIINAPCPVLVVR